MKIKLRKGGFVVTKSIGIIGGMGCDDLPI